MLQLPTRQSLVHVGHIFLGLHRGIERYTHVEKPEDVLLEVIFEAEIGDSLDDYADPIH